MGGLRYLLSTFLRDITVLKFACQTAQIKPQRGFDRLASMGFSESDIANFRRQFHSRSLMNYLDLDFETEEECVSLHCPNVIVNADVDQTTSMRDRLKNSGSILWTMQAQHRFRSHQLRPVLPYFKESLLDSSFPYSLSSLCVINRRRFSGKTARHTTQLPMLYYRA